MGHEVVQARVYLYGVFRGLEELVHLDEEARRISHGERQAVEFVVPNVGRATLVFSDQGCRFVPGASTDGVPDGGSSAARLPSTGDLPRVRPTIRARFTSPCHFMRMVKDGAAPIPTRGFTRLRFLTGTFTRLTDRLTHFVDLDDDDNRDEAETAAFVSAYIAFHALSEVGNFDPEVKDSARAIPDGVLQVEVPDRFALHLEAHAGRLTTYAGAHPHPRCVLWFRDPTSLAEVLHGTLHTYAGIGEGRLGMRGFIPMIDNLNPILGRIGRYLA